MIRTSLPSLLMSDIWPQTRSLGRMLEISFTPWNYGQDMIQLSVFVYSCRIGRLEKSLLLKIYLLLFSMHGCFACVCACIVRVCSAGRSQKRVLSLLELKLQTVMRLHLGAGDWNLVLCKISKGTLLQSHVSYHRKWVFYETQPSTY